MAKMLPMVSMAMSPEDRMETAMPVPAMIDKPEYPWGLRICLTHKELEKMDLDPAGAVVGGIVHLHALARITDVTMSDGQSGNSCRVEMTITDMCIESEEEENSEYDRPGRVLYDNKRERDDED